jgi:predicted CXXCH cytochrome family protein
MLRTCRWRGRAAVERAVLRLVDALPISWKWLRAALVVAVFRAPAGWERSSFALEASPPAKEAVKRGPERAEQALLQSGATDPAKATPSLTDRGQTERAQAEALKQANLELFGDSPSVNGSRLPQLHSAKAPGTPGTPSPMDGSTLGGSTLGGSTLGSTLDRHCESCHRFQGALTHPVNVVPATTPASLPLDGGRITCMTCHDERAQLPHGARRSSTSHLTGDSSDGAFLRLDSVETLCATCHDSGNRSASHASPGRALAGGGGVRPAPRTSREVASVHAMALLRAHLTERPGRAGLHGPIGYAASGGVRGADGTEVDHESATCLSCHDGTIATDVGGHAESGSLISDARRSKSRGILAAEMSGPASHPIGVPYRSTSGPGGIELRSASSLDPRIRLFNQQVGCGSCHSIYSAQAKFVVFPNERSSLCLSCHRM